MPSRSTSGSKRAGRGRPRSSRAGQAVLEAARALVVKDGYPTATIEAIAARSGVAKTTIYRRWPNRATLMVDLLTRIAATAAPPPSGRDPLRALRGELETVAQASNALPGQLLASLLSEAQHDPEIRVALAQRLFDPRRKATADMIARAQDAGLLQADVAPLVAVDLFFGPLFYRRYVRHERLNPGFVAQVFENVLAGLAPRGSRPKKRAPARGQRVAPSSRR